jgi:D-alanyl-D-alanine dipeptidase
MMKFLLQKNLKVLVSLLALLACVQSGFAAPSSVAGELQSADKVFILMAQRVDLMRDVALDKWLRRTPIEDRKREAVVLKNAQAEAAREGILHVAPLFRAQIEIAKNEQRRHQARWDAKGLERGVPAVVNLEQLRKRLDKQSRVFIPALNDALPSLRDRALHSRLKKQLDSRLIQLPAAERTLLWSGLLQLRFAPRRNNVPIESGKFRASDLVELAKLDRTLKLDIRYATTNNFAGRKIYEQPRAFLQRPAAQALLRAHRNLKKRGYGLIIFDGYRPWRVTKKFWDITPDDRKQFVADPNRGSRHNRGCAVDVSLYDLKTGRALLMPSDYDDFSARAYPGYNGGEAIARARRDLLRQVMEREGFTVYPTEWWHFDYKDWKHYLILDIPFSQLK